MAVTALRLCGASDGRDVRMNILDTLGYIARQTGHLEDAIDHLREARELCPPSDTFSLADILCTTGETYFQLRQPSEAERCLREALRLYREQQRAQDVLRAEAMLDRLAGKAPEPGAADWPYG
jgi:tetratricopeptide (TPR) repeat protein